MQIFHALFTPVPGGLEQSYVNTTEALASKGHTVTALLRRYAPYREDTAKFATVEPIDPLGFYDIRAAWKIRRLLLRERPDLIIGHNGRAITLLKMASHKTGIPVVGVSHSYKTLYALHADVLVVLSEHMRKHFAEAGYKERLEVIPNLIRLKEKPVLRARGNTVVIGAIGRLSQEKGFDDLLRALHYMKQSSTEFLLHLAGDGPEAPRLRALADKLGLGQKIRWFGWTEDKEAFYRGIDILCLPSRQDSFPMVILETLAHGVPIVATDAFGPATMLTHNTDALIVRRGDAQLLALALRKLIEQPELAAKLAENGWKTIQNYNFPAIAKRWDELLHSIVSETPVRKAA